MVVAAQPAIRAGLAALLTEAGIIVAEQTADLADWQGALPNVTSIDAVVLDPAEGVAEIEETAAMLPDVPIVVVGPVGDDRRLVVVLDGRPWGYLPRDADGDRIAAVVLAVASGLVAIDPAVASRVIGASLVPIGDVPADDLTPREREVLQLIALGLPNKTIAGRLSISEHTVKFHVAAILSRLAASSRTEAVRIGARRGLVVL